jgi:predicted dehydrogenase
MKKGRELMKKTKWGIIGTGKIANTFATALSGCENSELCAVASRTKEKAQAFAARLSIPRAYGSYADLLQDPDIGLVYIATPHSCHFENARDAILAGKPCLVEKSFMMNILSV